METKVEIIEQKVDGIHSKLDTFIECADNKYAEKARVNKIEEKVNKHDTKLAYWAGALAVIFVIVEYVMSHVI